MAEEVKVRDIAIGGANPLCLIAGPCVIESESGALKHAERLREITAELNVPFIYKSSYDKANKTIPGAYRGPGLEKGLRILKRVRDEFDLPVLSDIHCRDEIEPAAEVLDVLQIPALPSKQIDLITKAAETGRVVNLKKGQFAYPWDIANVIKKMESIGNPGLLLTERGFMFGYNTLVTDIRSLVVLQTFGYPVVYDASHAVVAHDSFGEKIGGNREFIPALAQAAVAAGVDALFLEVHENPDKALSDSMGSFRLGDLPGLLQRLIALRQTVLSFK